MPYVHEIVSKLDTPVSVMKKVNKKHFHRLFSPKSTASCESSLEIMIRATSQTEPIGTNIAKLEGIQNRIDDRRL